MATTVKNFGEMMKAAFIETIGSPEVITIGNLPTPGIHNNQVLVKIHTTTVNHIDCYIRSGKYPLVLPKPYIIGRDFCGEVIKVGSKVNSFQPGDKVWSNCQGIQGRQGTFAEYLAVDPQTIFHLPGNANPQEAVALFHSAFTAILGLTREAELRANDLLFVHGGSGNIGAAVIQVAKAMGAKVIASTHGEEKELYCKKMGADWVIDYKDNYQEKLKELAPEGVHVFWNTSRVHDFKSSLPLLAKKGRYILMSGSGSEAALPIGDLYTRDASIRGFTITNASPFEIQEAAGKINAMLERSALKAKIEKILRLENVKEAHELMEKDSLWGKIVINI